MWRSLVLVFVPCLAEMGCTDGDCREEPDGATMLQSHSNSFFRDVVEKVMDSSEACSSSYWDVGGATDPFDHNGNCGRGASCSRQAQNDYTNCWDIPDTCTTSSPVDSSARFYTKKFDSGSNPGSSVTVTPPSYACITGTCAKNGGGQDCFIISPAVIGQPVTIDAPDNRDSISNFRVQYACGLNCDAKSTTASTTGGGGGGDPHIRTMTGERYTLMKQGDFLAFSFKGKEAHSDLLPHKVPVDFNLFAHYNNGRKSFTRGLLLLDHLGNAMEMTSAECQWQVKKPGKEWMKLVDWRKSHTAELLFKGGGDYVAGFNISLAEQTYKMSSDIEGVSAENMKRFSKVVKGKVMLNMNTTAGITNLVKLKVKCYPGGHMNYKVKIYNPKEDLQFVGGEVGGADKSEKGHTGFFKVGEGMLQMRSDSAFQSQKSWQELGGSVSAASYFQSEDDVENAVELMTNPCNQADEQKAMEICGKAGHRKEDALSFAECVFDVCRTGTEAVPEILEMSDTDSD